MGELSKIGVLDNQRRQDPYIEGRLAGKNDTRSGLFPFKKQVSRVTLGGTVVNGDFSVVITKQNGQSYTVTHTRSGSETLTQVRDALVTEFANVPGLSRVASVAAQSTTSLDITFAKEGVEYTVTASAPGTATAAVSTQTSPSVSSLRLGLFYKVDTANSTADSIQVEALESGDDADDFTRDQLVFVPSAAVLGVIDEDNDNDFATAKSGDAITLCYGGYLVMRNYGSVEAKRFSQVYCVLNAASGSPVGSARANVTPNAGDSFLMSDNYYWADDVPSGELGRVFIKS